MLIKAKTTITDGVALTLTGNDDLIVGSQVALISTAANYAVLATGNNQTLTIAGLLQSSGSDCLHLDAATPGGRVTVTIAETGVILAPGDDAVATRDQAFNIVNNGRISSLYGFYVLDGTDSTSRITNTGTVLTRSEGVLASTDGVLIFNNSGQITSVTKASYFNSGDAQDFIRNSGVMRGSVVLGNGDDVYDGRGGRVLSNSGATPGIVLGGDGNDRFVPGGGAEMFFAEAGIDILDFRQSAGVRVSLDFNLRDTNTGVAKGDTYTGIEVLQGSLRGADVLRGDRFDETLSGNGGNDRLIGGEGNDILIGGTGRDALTGGTGDDVFVFRSPGDGPDVISDFSNAVDNNDIFRIDASAFGFGNRTGELAEQAFHIGSTNQAQDRSDRFIFRTGDETLWFDADGRGGKGPVLIADLQDGAVISSSDFLLV